MVNNEIRIKNKRIIIDNFEIIKPLLTFEDDDDFCFVQVSQHKKDNSKGVKDSNNSSRLIKAYYISSTKYLDRYKNEKR